MTLVEWVVLAAIVGSVLFVVRGIYLLRRQLMEQFRAASAWVRARPPLGLLLWSVPLGLLIVVGVVVLAWKVPIWQLSDVRPEAVERVDSSKEYFELLNAYRATIVQALGGLVVLIGIYFTWRRVAATERQVAIAGEGQITERFTRAIDQLGSKKPDGSTNPEVALGGIYALERIARDSEKDHWPIMEVLTAYVRANAPRRSKEEEEQRKGRAAEPPATHIQAILTVLARRTREWDKGRLDLHGTNLEAADLVGAHLEKANLSQAFLREADLRGADLRKADLFGADLSQAGLFEADLFGASLELTNVSRAVLWGAVLTEVQGLTREQLKSAHINEWTILPDYLKEGSEGQPEAPAEGGEEEG